MSCLPSNASSNTNARNVLEFHTISPHRHFMGELDATCSFWVTLNFNRTFLRLRVVDLRSRDSGSTTRPRRAQHCAQLLHGGERLPVHGRREHRRRTHVERCGVRVRDHIAHSAGMYMHFCVMKASPNFDTGAIEECELFVILHSSKQGGSFVPLDQRTARCVGEHAAWVFCHARTSIFDL